jgi:NO-binding membrane sensor protein with MHYT domain
MNLVLDSANDEQPNTSLQAPLEKSSRLLKAVASVTMGIAIPIMHYTAMAAVSYQSMPGSPDLSFSMEISALGYIAIIVIALVVLMSICLLRWWPTLGELPPLLHAKDGSAVK